MFERLEGSPVSIRVIAADALTRDEVCRSARPAVDAVRSSAAVPGVFAPINWQSRLLMDGGVHNDTPASPSNSEPIV